MVRTSSKSTPRPLPQSWVLYGRELIVYSIVSKLSEWCLLWGGEDSGAVSEMWMSTERGIKKTLKLLGKMFLVPLCYAAHIWSELICFWNILLSVLCRNDYILFKGICMFIAIQQYLNLSCLNDLLHL